MESVIFPDAANASGAAISARGPTSIALRETMEPILADAAGPGEVPLRDRHDLAQSIECRRSSYRAAGATAGGGIVAPSQCSSALPSLMRHISNHVDVYVFPAARGSGYWRTIATTTRSPSAVTDTTLVFQ